MATLRAAGTPTYVANVTEDWNYRNGLLVAIDCTSGKITGAVVTQYKQHPEMVTLECNERLTEK